MNTAINSPFKGFHPNVNPFGISPRYDRVIGIPQNTKSNLALINSSISKVDDRKDANAEIEKGEIVRQDLPNGGTLLHKATGKKHNQGGIPVNLPDGSFIFSNYKTTSLNKEELDKYELGGYNKKISNRTPSKILEKNVDIKHYNEMEKYLQETKDPVQYKTSQLMKQKYDDTIAKIAALQENKKLEKAPDFAYLSEDSPEKETNKIMTEMYQKGGLHNNSEYALDYNSNPLPFIKDYNRIPTNLSLIGNMAQYPRAFNPSLSLEQPVRLREQQISSRQGINDILANRYASLKATNLYTPLSVANSQFIDSDTNKQMVDYNNQVNQANQNVSTDIHNRNATEQNRVLNSNNDRRGQYVDKMNELYQNLANERNTINATNLNIIGKSMNEEENYNNTRDLLNKSYYWNVMNNMGNGNSLEKMKKQIKAINDMDLDDVTRKLWFSNLFKTGVQNKTNPYDQFLSSQH